MKTWLLVACRSGAFIYQRGSAVGPLSLVSHIDHPEGRLRDRDADTDSPGRSFDRGYFSQARHSMEPHEHPTEHAAAQFARSLADELAHARMEGRYQRLVVVAEPKFLGRVLGALDEPTRKLLAVQVPRDLVHLAPRDLEAQIAAL